MEGRKNMTNLEKQFLDCCTKNFADRSLIGSDDLLKHIDKPLIELQRCAEHLEKKGYIKNLHIQTRIRFNFQLTYPGTVRKEMFWENFKDFLLKSVFVPITVSVIASLIVASIGYLWSMESIREKSQSPMPQPTSELSTDTSGPNQRWSASMSSIQYPMLAGLSHSYQCFNLRNKSFTFSPLFLVVCVAIICHLNTIVNNYFVVLVTFCCFNSFSSWLIIFIHL